MKTGHDFFPCNKTILLVEDEALISFAQKKLLQGYGYTVITAHSGEKAIETVRSTPGINLILMDINLGTGKMDGTETAEIILKDHDIPILFLSSYTQPEIVEKTEKITSYGYVVKDSGETVLNASIRMAFKLHETHRELKESEEAMRESEERYRTLFEAAADGIVIHDARGKNIDANPRACEMLGYSRDELLEMPLSGLVPPEDLKQNPPRLNDALAGRPVCYERKLLRKDGTQLNIEIRAGRVTEDRVQAFWRDITDRKRADEDLRAERERLAGILRGTNTGTWEWNVQTGQALFNERWAEIIGYTLKEIFPASIETWEKFCHPDDLKVSADLLERHFRGDLDYYECEARMRHKSGEWVWVLDRGRVITWTGDGKPLTMMGTHQDITDRKMADEAIKRSEERFRVAQEMSPDGFTILHPVRNNEGRVVDFTWVYQNEAISRVNGYDTESIKGRRLLDLFPGHSETEIFDAYIDVAETGEPRIVEAMYQGETITIPTWFRLVVVSMGEDIAILAQDITARRQTEDALKASLGEKEILLKEIHHRVKNNLMVVSSILNLQSETIRDTKAKDLIVECRKRIQAMSLVHNRLYRSEDLAHIGFREYVDDLLADIAGSHGIVPEKVAFVTDIGDIAFDIETATPLGLIINELVSNAMKHAFPGESKGTITVNLHKQDSGFSLAVKDDGIGFPEGVDFTATESLGMQLVTTLVEQLEGTIELVGDYGTEFRVTFR